MYIFSISSEKFLREEKQDIRVPIQGADVSRGRGLIKLINRDVLINDIYFRSKYTKMFPMTPSAPICANYEEAFAPQFFVKLF